MRRDLAAVTAMANRSRPFGSIVRASGEGLAVRRKCAGTVGSPGRLGTYEGVRGGTNDTCSALKPYH